MDASHIRQLYGMWIFRSGLMLGTVCLIMYLYLHGRVYGSTTSLIQLVPSSIFSHRQLEGTSGIMNSGPLNRTVPAIIEERKFLRKVQQRRLRKSRITGECTEMKCRLPLCRCSGVDIPGDLDIEVTPMMVMLTFDDDVNANNFRLYQELLSKKRNNANGCPMKATFFVSKFRETDFNLVADLYKEGHEIGSHSISHRFPREWWGTAGYDDYVAEIEGMRRLLSDRAAIPYKQIRGMRVPFLAHGGENQYQMLEDFEFLFDSSMITKKRDGRPLWPFTLDFPVQEGANKFGPWSAPKTSHPSLWEVPLVVLSGNDNMDCAMADGCDSGDTRGEVQNFLMKNFKSHYETNKAPFGIFVHSEWFDFGPHVIQGLGDFLDNMLVMKDVWLVSLSQVVRWVSYPTSLSNITNFTAFKC